ncbi:uncharacterized protein LOC125076868 [Vanessa atalanta]|uniref:uncharacterized protein LOC125076868 n=1 Tax=Vanessa atalanta TaxID=42275 RepID=UPI001FCDAECC|nr:uncharacterized protein LOC125076868 [Vanessa atalanta]
MLSRREKLLVQPWEDRRYKDHRQKVRGARAAVDAAAPPARPHVALKLKKCQRERERRDKLCADNFSLLQRLAHVMAVNRLDNHWDRPLPDFHQKVGRYCERGARRRVPDPLAVAPPPAARCFACEHRKKSRITRASPLEPLAG